MKKLSFIKCIYILGCGALFLPWLSHNPEICGYIWGLHYGMYFALPLILTGIFVFSQKRGRLIRASGTLGSALNVLLCVAALGRFDAFTNVKGGWDFNLNAACPGFWTALAVYIILFAAIVNETRKKT